MNRYIGLDAHSSSCTVAVVGPSGKRLQSQVIETNAQALINFLLTIPASRHLCLEEGTHANWLYEVLSPHVKEMIVARVRESRGPKNDQIDAFVANDNYISPPRECVIVIDDLRPGREAADRCNQNRDLQEAIDLWAAGRTQPGLHGSCERHGSGEKPDQEFV